MKMLSKKIILLTVIIFSFTANLKAQNFGAVGTQWHYSCDWGYKTYYTHYESVLDTIINGNTTHKIIGIGYNSDTIKLEPTFLFERQDTLFIWDQKRSKFLVKFIFNRNVGDTLTFGIPKQMFFDTSFVDSSYSVVIKKVRNVTINGEVLKEYYYRGFGSKYTSSGTYLDRVGNLSKFNFNPFPLTLDHVCFIRCFKDQKIDTNFSNLTCDYLSLVGINEVVIKKQVEIYPNPTSNLITIKSKYLIEKIVLLDMVGKKIMTTEELSLNLFSLSKGTYFMQIHLKSGEKLKQKIIKN